MANLVKRSQLNMFWLLNSSEKEKICVALRRMLHLHTFKLLCFCVEEFLDVLLVKVKLGLLVLHELGPEKFPDHLLDGHILGHGAEQVVQGGELLLLPNLGHLGQVVVGGELLRLLLFHLRQLHRLLLRT